MIQYLLKNSDFAGLFRFVSPQFFKVISPIDLITVGGRVCSEESQKAAGERLASLPAQLVRNFSDKELGERALRIFFFQIFSSGTWVLDFRPRAFVRHSPGLTTWEPRTYSHTVEPEFLASVRAMYCGFYEGKNALFEGALRDLGLWPARDALKRHFGSGDQTCVEFRLKTFQSTFAEVFEACAREELRLKPDFLVLGLMLLGLYELLESLAVPFDVRGCFNEAVKEAASG